MLVTFSCEAYPSVTLFGNVAQALLKMMGCHDSASGNIAATEVAAVLEHLKSALATEKETSLDTSLDTQDADFSDETISLAHRAMPLMELLKVAAEKKCNVWWESR